MKRDDCCCALNLQASCLEHSNSQRCASDNQGLPCQVCQRSEFIFHEDMVPMLRTAARKMKHRWYRAEVSNSSTGMTKLTVRDFTCAYTTSEEKNQFHKECDTTRQNDSGMTYDDSGESDSSNGDSTQDEDVWWRVLGYPSCPESDWFGNPHVCQDIRYAQEVWMRLSGKAALNAQWMYCGGNLRSLFHLSHGVWVCRRRHAVRGKEKNSVKTFIKEFWCCPTQWFAGHGRVTELD